MRKNTDKVVFHQIKVIDAGAKEYCSEALQVVPISVPMMQGDASKPLEGKAINFMNFRTS
jgi:hypothetical protein